MSWNYCFISVFLFFFFHIWQKQCPNKTSLTPSNQAEFEQVSPDIDVKDPNEQKVDLKPLQSTPGQGGQQRPMQKETKNQANWAVLIFPQPFPETAQQEAEVEAEHCPCKLHVQTCGLLRTPPTTRETGLFIYHQFCRQ